MAIYEFEHPATKQVMKIDVPEGQSPEEAFQQVMEATGELPRMGGAKQAPAKPALQPGDDFDIADLDIDLGETLFERATGTDLDQELLRPIGDASRTMLTGIADMAPGFEGEELNVLPPALAESIGIGDLNRLESAEDVMGGARGLAEEIGLVESTEAERTPMREGLRMAGQSILPAAGIMKLLRGAAPALQMASRAPLPGFVEGAKRTGAQVLDHATERPVLAAAEETLGGFGAGFAGEIANEGGAGPLGEFVAELLGGIAAGTTPVGVQNLLRRGTRALTAMVPAPEFRAARRMQEMSADPAAAAEAARAAPSGVDPATASRDVGLQRLSNRVLSDDAKVGAKVEGELEAVREGSIEELAAMAQAGTQPGDWRHAVIESVAAPGATVAKGATDQMLKEAYDSYEVAYEAAKGFPITPKVMSEVGREEISLQKALAQAVMGRDVMVGNKARKPVLDYLMDQYQAVENVVARGARPGPRETLDSGALLQFRSRIRSEARRKAKAGRTNEKAAAQAVFLQRAENAITRVLESQLPPDVAAQLKAIDADYRDLVTVQDGVFRAGDLGEFEPKHLQTALRQRPNHGALARGEAGDLQTAVRQGADPAAALKDPELAARATRDMTPEQADGFRASMVAEVQSKSSFDRPDGTPSLSGKKLAVALREGRDAMKAAGFTDEDLGRMDRIANTLIMIDSRTPKEVQNLLEDAPGVVLRLVASIAGAKWGQRIAGGGIGASLVISGFGAQVMRQRLKELTVDGADALLREAMTNKELFAALLTRPVDPVKKQIEAAKIINAFLVPAAADVREDREQE